MNDCINFHPETFRDSFGSPKKIKKRTNRKRSSSFFEYMNNTSSDRSSNSQYSSETFRDSFISKSRSCSDLSSHESSPLNDDLKDANPFFSVPSVVDSSSSPTMMNWLCNQKIDNSSSSKSSSSGTSVDIDTSKIKHSNNFDLREVFLVFLLHQSCMNHQNFVTICHKLKQEGILPSMNIPEDLPKLQSIYKSFYPQIKTWLSEAQSEHASVLRKSGSESSLFDSLSNYSSHCKKQCKEIIPAPTPPVIAPTFFDMLLLNHASRLRLDFKLMRKLGHGGFGSVFHVSHRIDGREYAVKTVKFSFKNSYQLRKAYTKVVREVKSLANLDHPNVVRYHQTWFEPCNQFFEDLKDSNSEYSCSLDSEEDDEKIKYSTTRSNSNLGSYHYNNTSQEDNNNYNYNSNNSNEFYNKQMNIQYFDEPFQFPFDDIQEPQNVNLFDLENVSTNTSYSKYDSNYNLTSQCITNPSTVEFPESPPKCTADIPKVSANKLSKQSHNYINTKTTTNTSTNTNTTCSSSSSSSPSSSNPFQSPNALMHQFYNPKKGKFEAVMYIQMQLCNPETLEHWLMSPSRLNGTINEAENVNLIRQIVSGLSHIHKTGVIHRDLKPANIFFSEGQVKIGDFGLAKHFDQSKDDDNDNDDNENYSNDDIYDPSNNRFSSSTGPPKTMQVSSRALSQQLTHTTGIGTVTYASPEQMTCHTYNAKSDIYSLGIIIFEMYHPFTTKSERAMVLSKLRNGEIPESLKQRYPKQMDLVSKCMSKNASERPSANEILSIDWLELKYHESSLQELLQEKDRALQDQQKIIENLKNRLEKFESKSNEPYGCIAT